MIDAFVINDETKIKWSEKLKDNLQRGMYVDFNANNIRPAMFRPFCKKYLYFDHSLVERTYQMSDIFPNRQSENNLIWLKVGSEWPMFALMTNVIPDLLPQGGSQCFPFYTYDEDGSDRRENITD